MDSPGVGRARSRRSAGGRALPGARVASYASTRDRDLRLRRRPHDVRAGLHPRRGHRARPGRGARGAGRARRRHRRRSARRGDRPRRAARRRRRRRRGGRSEPRRRGGDRRRRRAARPRVRLRVVDGASCRCSWRWSRSRRPSCWSGRWRASPTSRSSSSSSSRWSGSPSRSTTRCSSSCAGARSAGRGMTGDEAVVPRCSTPAGPSSSAAPPSAISLLALVALPVPFLRSIGIAGMLIPLVSVAVAVTLLPVVLATIGPRLDWPRVRHEDRASRGWTAWARIVVRRRCTAALALDGRPRRPGPRRLLDPARQPAGRLARARPARPAPASSSSRPRASAPARCRRSTRSSAPATPTTSPATSPTSRASRAPSPRRTGATTAPRWSPSIPAADGNSPAGRETLDRIRAATAGMPADVVTGGEAAQSADFLDSVYGKLPARHRADRRADLRAARARLPLAGPAAQGRAAQPAVGRRRLGADWSSSGSTAGARTPSGASRPRTSINVEMPIVVFAFLFGISMDYQVFILSRMREAYDRDRLDRRGRRRGHRPHRPPGHQRGAHPRPGVRRHERRPRHRGEDVRHRARRRDPARRDAHPRRPRAGRWSRSSAAGTGGCRAAPARLLRVEPSPAAAPAPHAA